MLYIAGSELSESNVVGVKYRFILELKKIIVVKIYFTIYKKENKQTNKQTNKEKENKPMLGLT